MNVLPAPDFSTCPFHSRSLFSLRHALLVPQVSSGTGRFSMARDFNTYFSKHTGCTDGQQTIDTADRLHLLITPFLSKHEART